MRPAINRTVRQIGTQLGSCWRSRSRPENCNFANEQSAGTVDDGKLKVPQRFASCHDMLMVPAGWWCYAEHKEVDQQAQSRRQEKQQNRIWHSHRRQHEFERSDQAARPLGAHSNRQSKEAHANALMLNEPRMKLPTKPFKFELEQCRNSQHLDKYQSYFISQRHVGRKTHAGNVAAIARMFRSQL